MNVYLEGGRLLRPAMKTFLQRAVDTIHHLPVVLNVIPCGSGDDAIRKCAKDSNAVLLIDSEGPLSTQLTNRVSAQIGGSNHAFFMVELMEAWFLADQRALADYFGNEFNGNPLPGNRNVEEIPKQRVLNVLHSATRRCRKGAYNKTTHVTALLDQINPAFVYAACPNFALLINHIREYAAA